MLFDTTFVLDLQREFRRTHTGPARRFLDARPEIEVKISIVTVAEIAEGLPGDGEAACWALLSRYSVVELTPAIAWRAGQISRKLRGSGLHIGDHDILIAATAAHHELPLVTRNESHFRRVQGLGVIAYGEP